MSSVFECYRDEEVVLTKLRKTHWFLRSVSYVTVLVFLSSLVFPQFVQAQQAHETKAQQRAQINESKNLTESLKDFRSATQLKKQKVDRYLEEEGGYVEQALAFFGFSQLTMEEVSEFVELRERLKKHHEQELAEFAKTKQWIEEKQLGDEVQKRHQSMVDEHNQQYQELENYLQTLFESESIHEQSWALNKLSSYAEELKLERSHEFTDPNQLPWGIRDASKAPLPMDSQQLQERFHQAPAAQGDNQASLLNNGIQNLEAYLIATANAEESSPPENYLAETVEVKFTPDIIAKAAELNHHPVEIYNWVRNNVESVPTFGSIQGADMTLATLKGNSFDIASLLIALLRASGIQARYAYGGVFIEADQVMNWVGNAGTPQAAVNLMAQGGIPVKSVALGGKITHIQMEQVWVEAFVDYEPGRGIHKESPDTWIPMDASFKQYDYTPGYDLATQVPFDAQGLIDDIMATAVIDEAAGTIQNVDQTIIETAFTSYQTQIETYINNQDPEATVGDVLGTKKTIVFEPEQLASGLPYHMTVKGVDFADLPDEFRHKWNVQIQTKDKYGSGTTLIQITKNLAEINDKTLAIHFDPATEQDEQIITSLLPEPDVSSPEGTGDINPEDLPQSLPAHLINMVANIAVDEQNQSTSTPMKMGTELNLKQGLFDPVYGWTYTDSTLIAGEYVALGVNGSHINPKLLNKVKTQLEQAKTELESIQEQQQNNETPTISDFLTKHTLTGNILQTTILSYFALNNLQDQLAAQSSKNVLNTNLQSFGTFSTKLSPLYGFGGLTISKVNFSGVGMDVDMYLWATASNRNNPQDMIAFHRAAGSRLSAMEHIVPEEVFKDEANPENSPKGVSAVKALSIAAQQGQKIYTLTKTNQNQLQYVTADAAIKKEITDAIKQGKEVTIHESPITAYGWTGSSYTIIDPYNGTGAYKISGGLNGGHFTSSDTLFLGAFSIHYGKDFKELFELRNGGHPSFSILAKIQLILGQMKKSLEKLLNSTADTVQRIYLELALSGLESAYKISYFDELTIGGVPGLSVVMTSLSLIIGVYVIPYLKAVSDTL